LVRAVPTLAKEDFRLGEKKSRSTRMGTSKVVLRGGCRSGWAAGGEEYPFLITPRSSKRGKEDRRGGGGGRWEGKEAAHSKRGGFHSRPGERPGTTRNHHSMFVKLVSRNIGGVGRVGGGGRGEREKMSPDLKSNCSERWVDTE